MTTKPDSHHFPVDPNCQACADQKAARIRAFAGLTEPTGDRLINQETNAKEIHVSDKHAGDFDQCGRCQADWGRTF